MMAVKEWYGQEAVGGVVKWLQELSTENSRECGEDGVETGG